MTCKIAMLQPMTIQNKVFNETHIKQLSDLGTLLEKSDADELTSELAQIWIRSADIVITSWGCPPLERKLLELAPN